MCCGIDLFTSELNELLTTTYRYIIKVEEASLKGSGRDPLSISEIHLLESVGKGKEQGRTVTSIAQELGVTLPGVTMGINKLEKKGYVTRERGEGDKRMVLIKLTSAGRRAETAHRFFHRQMVLAVSHSIGEEERPALLKTLAALQGFLQERVAEIERGHGRHIGPNGGKGV